MQFAHLATWTTFFTAVKSFTVQALWAMDLKHKTFYCRK
jgi:hypothetical protein